MMDFSRFAFFFVICVCAVGATRVHESSLETSSEAVKVPMFGDFEAIYMYYTIVSVGTPPVDFTVTVDTGSSDFIIPQMGCDGCFAGDPKKYYNASSSSTATPIACDNPRYNCKSCVQNQCATDVNYGGSVIEKQVLFEDVVKIGGVEVTSTFGAIYKVIFNGSDVTDSPPRYRRDGPPDMPEGMLGMAYPALVNSKATPLFDNLVEAGKVHNLFSHCLTEHGGMLVLGGIGDYYTGELQYTPITAESFYNVHMDDVLLNGKSIGVPSEVYNKKYCIVDSGTPAPTFPVEAMQAFRQGFMDLCAETKLHGMCDVPSNATLLDQVCYSFTPEQIAAFPTVTFAMKGGANLDWKPQSYLMPQFYCDAGQVGIYVTAPGDGFTVLGVCYVRGLLELNSPQWTRHTQAEFLQSFHTVHDRANHRMGFAPVANCPSFT